MGLVSCTDTNQVVVHCSMECGTEFFEGWLVQCPANLATFNTCYILCFSLTRSRIMIIVRKKGSMQVGVGVNSAWSRSRLHSTSLSRRVCGLRQNAAYRPRQNPPAIVRTRCAVSEPASERQGEHQNHARLVCSLLAAVTLVSLARTTVIENSTLHRLCLLAGQRFHDMPHGPTLLHGHCECHAGHVPSLCLRQGWVHPARPVSGYGGGDAAADTVTPENRAVFSA